MYTVDEIINDIASLENLETRNITYVNIRYLPINTKEQDILKIENGIFIKDEKAKQERVESIRDKFERLKNN